jgi:hypothetical protein
VLGRPVPGPLLPEDGQPWTSCALFDVACHSIPCAVPCGSHLAPPDVCLAPCSTAAPGNCTSCSTVCVAARYPTTGVCGSDATTSVSFCLSCVSAMLCCAYYGLTRQSWRSGGPQVAHTSRARRGHWFAACQGALDAARHCVVPFPASLVDVRCSGCYSGMSLALRQRGAAGPTCAQGVQPLRHDIRVLRASPGVGAQSNRLNAASV